MTKSQKYVYHALRKPLQISKTERTLQVFVVLKVQNKPEKGATNVAQVRRVDFVTQADHIPTELGSKFLQGLTKGSKLLIVDTQIEKELQSENFEK